MLDVKKNKKTKKKETWRFLHTFLRFSRTREIFSRYEILLVYYLKSDSAATTFDFFQLAMRSQRFAKTLRILDKVNFIGEKCGQSSFWNSVIDILSPFIRRSPRRRLSVLDRLFINTRSMSPLSLPSRGNMKINESCRANIFSTLHLPSALHPPTIFR